MRKWTNDMIKEQEQIWAEKKFPIMEVDFDDRLQNEILPWVEKTLKDDYFYSEEGVRMHYYHAVHPQERAAIVISHGFCEFAQKFFEIMYYFYEMGYSVFFVEHRGHGFSQRFVEEYDRVYVKSYDEYVSDFHAFMEQIVTKESVTKEYILFAHSMGGTVGTLYMEEHPEYFKKAVLSAPMMEMNFRGFPMWQVRLLMVVSKVLRWDLKYVPGQHGFDNINRHETSSSASKARYDYQFKCRQTVPQYTTYGGTYAWTRASIKAIKKLHKNVDKIQVPVLLFQAGLDGMVSPGGQNAFAENTKNTKFVRFDQSKHEVFNATDEIIAKYYPMIFEFLEE